MTLFLATLLVTLLYAFSVYGWGRITLKFAFGEMAPSSIPYTITTGIAALIFLGGVLNTLHIAYTGVLTFLLLCGFGFTIHLERHKLIQLKNLSLHSLLDSLSTPKTHHILALLTAILAIFLIHNLLPSNNFNFHDDLHSYMTRLSLMSQTGDLGQNPIAIIGLDSLGAQAFMQSFATGIFGLNYANAFDAVFCFILSCAMILAISKELNSNWIVASASLSVLIMLNMQQVNLSSIYSTIVLILGLAYTHICWEKALPQPHHSSPYKTLTPTFLFLSSLIAMKLLTAFFTAYLFIFMFALIHYNSQRLKAFFISGGLLTLFASPWFLVHIEKYFVAITKRIDGTNSNTEAGIDFASNIENIPFDNFFASQELFWGGNLFGYNLLFTLTALLAVALLIRYRSISTRNLILLPLCSATILAYITGALFFEYSMALRYSLPFLAASFSIAILFMGTPIENSKQRDQKATIGIYSLCSVCLIVTIMLHSFYESFDRRIEVSKSINGTMMFPTNNSYHTYLAQAISDEQTNLYRELQEKCPAEKPIFAWVSTPYNFDFDKNQILYMTEPQTLTPWYNLSPTNNPIDFDSQLRELGAECVIWEYKGTGMKPIQEFRKYQKSPSILYQRIGNNVVNLATALQSLAKASDILMHKNGTIVFSLGKIAPTNSQG